jgi:hypothetical protein
MMLSVWRNFATPDPIFLALKLSQFSSLKTRFALNMGRNREVRLEPGDNIYQIKELLDGATSWSTVHGSENGHCNKVFLANVGLRRGSVFFQSHFFVLLL